MITATMYFGPRTLVQDLSCATLTVTVPLHGSYQGHIHGLGTEAGTAAERLFPRPPLTPGSSMVRAVRRAAAGQEAAAEANDALSLVYAAYERDEGKGTPRSGRPTRRPELQALQGDG